MQLFWCRREGWDEDVPCPVGLCRDTLGPLWCVNRGGTLYIYLRFTPVYRYTSYCKRGLCIPTSYTLLTSRYIAGKLATSEVALYPPPIHTWCTCFPVGAWIQHNFKRNKQLSGYMNRTYIIDMFISRNKSFYYYFFYLKETITRPEYKTVVYFKYDFHF